MAGVSSGVTRKSNKPFWVHTVDGIPQAERADEDTGSGLLTSNPGAFPPLWPRSCGGDARFCPRGTGWHGFVQSDPEGGRELLSEPRGASDLISPVPSFLEEEAICPS